MIVRAEKKQLLSKLHEDHNIDISFLLLAFKKFRDKDNSNTYQLNFDLFCEILQIEPIGEYVIFEREARESHSHYEITRCTHSYQSLATKSTRTLTRTPSNNTGTDASSLSLIATSPTQSMYESSYLDWQTFPVEIVRKNHVFVLSSLMRIVTVSSPKTSSVRCCVQITWKQTPSVLIASARQYLGTVTKMVIIALIPRSFLILPRNFPIFYFLRLRPRSSSSSILLK